MRRGQKHNGRFVPGVPAWIQQREALFEKYDRRLDRLVDPGGEPADQPSVLYHYTTWEGFEGILKSQEFWAFDHRDMKDPRELRPAEDAIKNVLAEMQATTDGPLRDLVDLVSASYPMRLAADFVIVYLTCFSRARDKFYFWEQRDEGVCLGIPVLRNEQLPTVPKLGRQMMKVEYEFSGWREDLRACFRKMLDAYAAFLAEPQKWDLLPRMTELTKNAFERFAAKTSIASKDRIPYEAEEEWRYIALPFGRVSGPPVFTSDDGRHYLKLPFRKFKRPLLIQEAIVYGPEPDSLVAKARSFLEATGYRAGGPGTPTVLASQHAFRLPRQA